MMNGAEADAEAAPSLVQSYGPEAITALVSALLVMFSTRR